MARKQAAEQQIIPREVIERRIYLIRQHKVILDSDLADLNGVETFNLNKAVKRNLDRFPLDFMFQLTRGRGQRFEIPNWNVKTQWPWGPAISPVRVHRGRHGHAFKRAKQQEGRAGEHRDHANVRSAVLHPGNAQRLGGKARDDGEEIR